MWSNSGPHFGVHIWTQKWGQPSENFVAARKCFASRFATQQPEHECQHIPFSLCASQGRLLLSRSLYRSHVLNTFFGPVLEAMMKQVCWHSRRSEAHRGLPEARGPPEARPRTQNVMARGQSEAHGDSNLYNKRQDWMIWNQKMLAMITSQDIHCFYESLQSKMWTHAPCGTLTSKHMHIFVPRCVPFLLRNKEDTMWPPWPHLHVILHFFSR